MIQSMDVKYELRGVRGITRRYIIIIDTIRESTMGCWGGVNHHEN